MTTVKQVLAEVIGSETGMAPDLLALAINAEITGDGELTAEQEAVLRSELAQHDIKAEIAKGMTTKGMTTERKRLLKKNRSRKGKKK